jgi:DNA polymerase-3 subunit delta'
MTWQRVIGQQRVKGILLSALRADRLPHAYLFYGNEGVGKDATALELARVLHCSTLWGDAGPNSLFFETTEACGVCHSCLRMNSLQHTDVKLIMPLPVGRGERSDDPPLAKLTEAEVKIIQEQLKLKGDNPYHRVIIPKANIIKINSVREMRRESSLTTSDKRKRVFVVSHADEMGDDAANTILKTLEEPPGNTMLILTTAHRDALLPTIVSRCQNVHFDPLTEDEIRDALIERNTVEPQQASLVARLADGSYVRAIELLQNDISQEREGVLAFIRHALGADIVALTEDIERISAPKDREGVVRFLTLLLIWFRDAFVMLQGGAIINVDQESELQRFVQKFPGAQLSQVLRDIEKAISLVDRNVYITLVMLQLSVKLRANILSQEAPALFGRESLPTPL